MNKIRTRFAPSPTGYLHIGSLRTILFSYLIAKTKNGKLILRIEDTDQKRKIKGSEEKILEIINWIGIDFDEGPVLTRSADNKSNFILGSKGNFGPYIQSQRQKIYDKYIKDLLHRGEAYYCFCSPERLQKMRQDQQAKKLPPRYDRHCRNLSQKEVEKKIALGEKYVIRQKMPLDGEVIVKDELRGEIKFNASELEDHILIKSNGIPTYQFAAVIDDHLMEISHVLRGEEWIPSFPKNILLYKAFGWKPPKFIHLPLTLNKGGGKLSKRQGDVTIDDYRTKGYLPEALINFSALLGWHPKNNKEIFTLQELINEFKIKDMGSSPAVFDIDKLDYLNGYYIRKKTTDELLKLCQPYLEQYWQEKKNNIKENFSLILAKLNDFSYLKKIIAIDKERLKKLSDIGEATEFFFSSPSYEPNLLIWKKMDAIQTKNNLELILKLLKKIPKENWTNDSIEEGIIDYLQIKNLKIGEYLWPMRVALSGRKASPGPFDIAEILGLEETLSRIKKAIEILN